MATYTLFDRVTALAKAAIQSEGDVDTRCYSRFNHTVQMPWQRFNVELAHRQANPLQQRALAFPRRNLSSY